MLGDPLLTLTSPPLPAGIRAYEQLGYRAFGTPGKLAAAIAITLQNIGGEDGAVGETWRGWEGHTGPEHTGTA